MDVPWKKPAVLHRRAKRMICLQSQKERTESGVGITEKPDGAVLMLVRDAVTVQDSLSNGE